MTREHDKAPSLIESLNYEPRPLRFGTSGRRGEVVHLTQLEIYINALAELRYLQSLPPEGGGISRGDPLYFAYDLRPSSSRLVEGEQQRGEIAQAIERAISDAGMAPVNLGKIPTPALASYALDRGKGSMMITGSHIPFNMNGYKTYSGVGELLKSDEAPINARVQEVREEVYGQPCDQSLFGPHGMFKCGHLDLSQETDAAPIAYMRRYRDFFGAGCLADLRILVYQHSAVGRDIVVDILEQLGADVTPAGRVDGFVAVDTENVNREMLETIQSMVDSASADGTRFDAVVSTDGDSDRPLICGIDNTGSARFFGGDRVGMVAAEYLRAGAVVVPISCNDAIDHGRLAAILEPKTRIGSPYVVAGMQKALQKGRQSVCGWEANGGFFTASDLVQDGRALRQLPTRDAMLPILAILCAMREQRCPMIEFFDRLPQRFNRSALLGQFPREKGRAIVKRLSPADAKTRRIVFEAGHIKFLDESGSELSVSESEVSEAKSLRDQLAGFYPPSLGFGAIVHMDYTDGVRVLFDNGDVAHIRPSGNADEFRIYAMADSQQRADTIAETAVTEPDGILRRMERAFG